MEQGAYRYVFGPVMSGRLGRSLGLDLLGARICSMNCAYCESGRLERLTLARAPYVPAAELLAELAEWERLRKLRGEPRPDVVTLGGLGEPTLNSEMAQVIAGVRSILPGVPVAVLTNSSLMGDAQVRAELCLADMVLPSMDALDPEAFRRVNRAHPDLDPKVIADGLLAFRKAYAGRLYLEILLVGGVNDTERNLELLREFCNHLQPDRVDLVTLSRPGTEPWARPADAAVLARWRAALSPWTAPGAPRAPLAQPREKMQEQRGGFSPDTPMGELRERILASLERRPQTPEQLASALLASEEDIGRALAELLTQGLAEEIRRDGAAQAGPDSGAGGADAPRYYQARRG